MRGLVLVCLLSSCVRSSTVSCADGSFCPADTTCDVDRNRCITHEQTAVCENVAEGAECTVLGAPGTCRDRACELWICGDGVRSINESCDGDELGGATCESLGFAETTTGLACNSLCLFDTSGCSGVCGDGVVTGSEQCDRTELDGGTCTSLGFYDEGAITCTANCTWNAAGCTGFCGDGVTNGPELCDGAPPAETCVDLGYDAGPSACGAGCSPSFAQCARFGWRPEVLAAAPSQLAAATSAPGGDAWVVGRGGFAARLHGGVWTATPTGVTADLVAVSAAGTQVAAFGYTTGGPFVVIVATGTAWSALPALPTAVTPTSIAVVAGRVYLATSGAGVLSWDGTTWTTVGTLSGAQFAIAGTSANDLWVGRDDGLYHWDGTSWQQARPAAVTNIIAFGATDVVIAGRDAASFGSPPLLAHWDGTAWSDYRPPMVAALAGTSIRNIFVLHQGNLGVLSHFDGVRFVETTRLAPSSTISGLAVLGTGNAIATDQDGVVYRYRGQNTTEVLQNVAGATALWSDGGTKSFVATNNGRVFTPNGGSWSGTVVASGRLDAVYGFSGNDVFVGGSQGTLYHWDGAAWSSVKSGLGAIKVIWGTSANDLWVFGEAGAWSFDGSVWTAHPLGIITAAAGSSSNDVWAVSTAGTQTNNLYRWTGTAWTLARAATDATMISVLAPNSVYVAYGARGVLHWDGVAWTEIAVPSTNPITRVAALASDDVFVAGSPMTGADSTTMSHFDGTRWSPVRVGRPPSSATPFSLLALVAQRHRIDVFYASVVMMAIETITRTRPWVCRASETQCSDEVDDDCDDLVDADDPDC